MSNSDTTILITGASVLIVVGVIEAYNTSRINRLIQDVDGLNDKLDEVLRLTKYTANQFKYQQPQKALAQQEQQTKKAELQEKKNEMQRKAEQLKKQQQQQQKEKEQKERERLIQLKKEQLQQQLQQQRNNRRVPEPEPEEEEEEEDVYAEEMADADEIDELYEQAAEANYEEQDQGDLDDDELIRREIMREISTLGSN